MSEQSNWAIDSKSCALLKLQLRIERDVPHSVIALVAFIFDTAEQQNPDQT